MALVGGVTFAPGMVGQAFSFDGATGFVQIPSSSALQPPSAISIDAWVYPTAFPPPPSGGSVIISKYDSANGGGYSWALLMQPTGQVEWYVIGPFQDPSSQIEVVTVGALSLGAWQHVAATYDTATQAIAVYVNGVQIPTTCGICGTVTSIYQSSANVLIGALISGNSGAVPSNLWSGLIDEIEVFNRVLSASEIQAIYNAGSAGKCKYAAQVQPPISADGSSVFNAKRGVVPVKFTLTLSGAPTCQLPPATIALTRTAGAAPGPIDESVFLLASDSGSNFRIDSCQYVYNLASGSLGPGTYLVQIKISDSVVGSATFGLQ